MTVRLSVESSLPVDLLARLRGAGSGTIRCLADEWGVSLRQAASALADEFGMPFFAMDDLSAQTPAFDRLPLPRAQQLRAALLRSGGGKSAFVAVVSDPFDRDLQVQLEERAGAAVTYALATPEDIHAYLNTVWLVNFLIC